VRAGADSLCIGMLPGADGTNRKPVLLIRCRPVQPERKALTAAATFIKWPVMITGCYGRPLWRPSMTKNLTRASAKTPKKQTRPATTFLSQTVAKDRFLAHCRHVVETQEFVCVKDQSGEAFLTLSARPVKGGFATVSAQFFKDNFARCSSLIRDGVAFRLTLRGSNQVVYARRHTSYKDPVDFVIDEWRESIVKAAMPNADESAISQLARDFATFASRQGERSDEDREVARDRYQALVRSITRMAIGHLPIEEGRMPNHDP
jgi:hypothetical protein